MKTTAIALAAVLAAGTATIAAYAQPAPGPQSPQQQQRWQPSPADRAAFLDARLAALKAGLKLSAEQDKLWGPLEATIRDTATKRQERMAELRKQRAAQTTPPDMLERMKRRADFMADAAADMRRVVGAAEPLYKTLDDGQKHRLAALMRFGQRGMMRGEFGHHRFGEGYGPGGNGPGWRHGQMGQGMGPGMMGQGMGPGMGPGSRF